jgi:chromosome segregation ATPase
MGAYYLAFYFALEAFLDKVGWLSRLQTGGSSVRGSKSNRRLIGLSLLLFIGFMGSPLFTPLLLIARDSIFLMIAVMSVVALLGILQGGYFFSSGAGKAAHAGGREYLNDAKNRLQESKQLMNQAEQEEQDSEARREGGDSSTGDQEARDAAGKLQNALEDMATAIEDLELFMDKDEKYIEEDIIRPVRMMGDARGPEKEFERDAEKLKVVTALIHKNANTSNVSASLNNDLNAAGAPINGINTLKDARNLVNKVYSDLEAFATTEKNVEGSMEQEMGELVDLVQDVRNLDELLEALPSEIDEARNDANMLEKLSQEYGDENLAENVGMEESEIENILNGINELEAKRKELESEIQKAEQVFEEQLQLEDSELQELEKIKQNILPDINENVEKALQRLQANSNFKGTGASEQSITDMLERLENESLLVLIEDIEERMRGEENSLRNKLNNLF